MSQYPLLESVKSPHDLREMSLDQLGELAHVRAVGGAAQAGGDGVGKVDGHQLAVDLVHDGQHLFGALEAGGRQMQVDAGVSIDLIGIIQALIIVFIAAPLLVRALFPWGFRQAQSEGS